jgi:hypothetical protein
MTLIYDIIKFVLKPDRDFFKRLLVRQGDILDDEVPVIAIGIIYNSPYGFGPMPGKRFLAWGLS